MYQHSCEICNKQFTPGNSTNVTVAGHQYYACMDCWYFISKARKVQRGAEDINASNNYYQYFTGLRNYNRLDSSFRNFVEMNPEESRNIAEAAVKEKFILQTTASVVPGYIIKKSLGTICTDEDLEENPDFFIKQLAVEFGGNAIIGLQYSHITDTKGTVFGGYGSTKSSLKRILAGTAVVIEKIEE